MSMPVFNHNALYGAKNSALQPLPRANFFVSPASSGNAGSQPFSQASTLAPTSLGGLRQDQVCFSGKKDTPEATDIGKADSTSQNSGQKAGNHYQTHQLGYHQNNAREFARIVLCDIAPLALSVMPLLGLPGVGVLFAVASFPLSYYMGHLGRRIAKNVNTENLHPAFQYIHKVKKVLTTSYNGNPDNLVNAINEAGDVFANHKLFSSILPKLKVQPNSGIAKILGKINNMAILRIEVNNRLAQAKNAKEAGKAVLDGAKNAGFYIAMAEIGTALTVSSFPGAKIVGELLKNAGLLKIGVDLLRDKETK